MATACVYPLGRPKGKWTERFSNVAFWQHPAATESHLKRYMLAVNVYVDVATGVVSIFGDAAADSAYVVESSATETQIQYNGSQTLNYATSDVNEIKFWAGDGPDFFQNDTAIISFFAGQNGNDTFQGGSNDDTGLNVSSCDGLPSLICVGKTAAAVKELNAKLAPLAFDEKLAGKFGYASALVGEELGVIEGYESQTGILLIQPGEYGMDGSLVTVFPANVDPSDLHSDLLRHANSVQKITKHHNQHVRKGRETGKNWESKIPVTDPMSLRAMQRQMPRANGPTGRN